MGTTDRRHSYVAQERGDRTRPPRSHPRYWVLTLLLQKLERVVASEWLPAGDTALDYGCGNKPYEALFRRKFSEFVGADYAGNSHADLVIGPGGKLPVEDQSIDCVVSTQVLEHVEDPRVYLAEAYRALKPGGSLVLSTHGMWRYHADPADYWRWTLDGLHLELYHAGFDVWWTQSILGLASCALLLWQDATADSFPRWVRRPYTWLMQSAIGLFERWQPDNLSWDACIYVVLARKGERARPGLELA